MSATNSPINSAAVFGDVTSLTLATLPHGNGTFTDILLGATGSQIHVFLLPDCQHLFSQTVLPNAARCHGIATCTLSTSFQTTPTTLLAVHGDRHVNVFALDPLHLSNQLVFVASLPRLTSWAMAVSIFSSFSPPSEENSADSSDAAIVTVGLSDNSVELYRINTSSSITNEALPDGSGGGGSGALSVVEFIKRVECTDRCLLYSMDLFIDNTAGVYYVAGGTIFLDVVIWKIEISNNTTVTATSSSSSFPPTSGASNNSSMHVLEADVLYRLKGHEGSIHSVRWSPSGTILASGSDDRTVRIWNIPSFEKQLENNVNDNNGHTSTSNENESEKEKEEAVYLSPRKVLYGHLARLWGFHFTQDESIVISCSEDRTCKFWDITSDSLSSSIAHHNNGGGGGNSKKVKTKAENLNFATLKAHRHRGVWHCCIYGSILFTGGADGAIKAWNLWDLVEPNYVERIFSAAASASKKNSTSPFFSSGKEEELASSIGNDTTAMHSCPWVSTTLLCDLPDPEATTVGTLTLPLPPPPPPPAKVVVEEEKSSLSSKKKQAKTACDSLSEWVRCLAITKDHSTVFVATNRGLIHQVQLPVVPLTSTAGPPATAATTAATEEKWLTIYKSERKRPITSIKLEEQNNKVGYISICDIAGYATVLHRTTDGIADGWYFQEWLPYDSGLVSGIYFLFIKLMDNLVFTTGPQGRLTLWQLASVEVDVPPRRLAESCCDLKKSTQIVDIDTLQTSKGSSNAWLVASGTSCGAVVICQLTMKTQNGGDGDVSDFHLEILSCLKNVHLGSPVRAVNFINSACSGSENSTNNTIVLESCGSNGAIVRFLVRTNGSLSIMVEEHYDALLIIAGKVDDSSGSSSKNGTPTSATATSQSQSHSQLVYGFQSTDFLVWDAKSEAEVCSINCGSWRRPWAAQISAADTLTFCCDRGVAGAKISVHTRRPQLKIASPFPRALLPPGHGREINAVGIQCANADLNNQKFVCFTVGEDSSVRQAVVDFSKNPSLREIGIITDHVGGTTVKSLTMVDFFSGGGSGDGGGGGGTSGSLEKKRKTLLVTGGSKKVLMAWIVQEHGDINSQRTSAAAAAAAVTSEDGLHLDFVSSHAVQNIISCKNLPSGKPISAVEIRYLAISAIIPCSSTSPTHAFILAGCSNGPVELLSLPLDEEERPSYLANTWELVALLQHHTCPIISTQALNPIFHGSIGDTNHNYVAFTAGTDGECAVWDLSYCIEAYLAQHQRHGFEKNNKNFQVLEAERGRKEGAWETHNLQPIHVISGVHQSGINGMSAAQVISDNSAAAADHAAEVVVVTVGDDQGLTASLVKLTKNNSEVLLSEINELSLSPTPLLKTLECTVRAQVKEPNAHSSAARGVWTDGNVAFSTGIDQKVRKWELARIYSPTPPLSNGSGGGGSGNGSSDSVSMSIKETGCVVTQVLEPLSLDVAVANGIDNKEVLMKVAVAGRGMQVIEWR